MVLSQATVNDVLKYLRLDEEEETGNIQLIMDAAKAFIFSYTGISSLEADEHEDITIAFMVLCGEMFDNRLYTVESDKLNPITKGILDLYSRNLL